MSAMTSPFYVDGPIREARNQGVFHGADGSRRVPIEDIRAWYGEYQKAITQQPNKPNTQVFQIIGARKVGKTSTIYAALESPGKTGVEIFFHICAEDWVESIRSAIIEMVGGFPQIEELKQELETATVNSRTTDKLQCFSECMRTLWDAKVRLPIIVILEFRGRKEFERETQAMAVMAKESGAMLLIEAPNLLDPKKPKGLGAAKLGDMKSTRIMPFTPDEAHTLLCGRSGMRPPFCKYPEGCDRVGNGSQKDSDCYPFGDLVSRNVGCHPWLLEKTCIELQRRMDGAYNGNAEEFVKYCLIEMVTQRDNSLQDDIRALAKALPDELFSALLYGARDDKLPDEFGPSLGERGLAYKDGGNWKLPELIKKRVLRL